MDIIEELENIGGSNQQHKIANKAIEEIERLRQQNAELLEALRPFAKLASIYDPPEDDDDEVTWYRRSTPTLGQLRTARAAIAKATGGA